NEKSAKSIDWEILDDPFPCVQGDRALNRRGHDCYNIHHIRLRAENKTESLARPRLRASVEAAGVELHIGFSSTAHTSIRRQLNDRQCGDAATGPFIADLDSGLVPGA